MKHRRPVTEISEEYDKSKLFGVRQDRSDRRLTFSKVLCIFSDVILAYCLFLTTYSIFEYFSIMNDFSYMQSVGISVQPDLSYLAYLLPAAFVFAGLTHTFYYNKERFANCIKIRFEYIKQLLMFKLNSGLYDHDELTMQLDSIINQAEVEADALIANDLNSTEQEQSNINV